MAQAKKTINVRPAKHTSTARSTTNNKKGSPSPTNGVITPTRQSPVQGSNRTSPGLLAGHYAGCKFSEPPLPSALPLPPQHWMMQSPHTALTAFRLPKCEPQHDIAQQLKVLLKVQA